MHVEVSDKATLSIGPTATTSLSRRGRNQAEPRSSKPAKFTYVSDGVVIHQSETNNPVRVPMLRAMLNDTSRYTGEKLRAIRGGWGAPVEVLKANAIAAADLMKGPRP